MAGVSCATAVRIGKVEVSDRPRAALQVPPPKRTVDGAIDPKRTVARPQELMLGTRSNHFNAGLVSSSYDTLTVCAFVGFNFFSSMQLLLQRQPARFVLGELGAFGEKVL